MTALAALLRKVKTPELHISWKSHVLQVSRRRLRISLFIKQIFGKKPSRKLSWLEITIFNLGNTSSFRIHFPLLGYLFFRSGDSGWAEWCWNAQSGFLSIDIYPSIQGFLVLSYLPSNKKELEMPQELWEKWWENPWNGGPLHNQPHIHLMGKKGSEWRGVNPKGFPTIFLKEISGVLWGSSHLVSI